MKTLSKSFILILIFLASFVLCQVNYSDQIQPIFNNNCIGCHGGNGGLFLTSYENVIAGGNSGVVVTPEDGANSLIIQKLRGTAQGSQMPMGGNPLDESVISLIETWIDEGANETTQLSNISENRLYPNELSIIGNYPNPFNPVTHFQVYSPIAQKGKVTIINLSGQKVVDLGIVHLNPGIQNFSWNHQTFVNLSSGQYLFFLKTDELTVTHRISLIK